jgi:hypothetical protein
MLRKLYGFSYSFTGHANDIFCENDFPITNAMLVRGREARGHRDGLRAAMDGGKASIRPRPDRARL